MGPFVTEVKRRGQNLFLLLRQIAMLTAGDAVIVGVIQHQRIGYADVVGLHKPYHRDADAARQRHSGGQKVLRWLCDMGNTVACFKQLPLTHALNVAALA